MKQKPKFLTFLIVIILFILLNYFFTYAIELNQLKLKYHYFSSKNKTSQKYNETAFSRFQVIFFSTLPLTMFITFSAIQVYEMKKQRTISPFISKKDLKLMLTISISSSTFIALKDILNWRKHQKNEGKKKGSKKN